jgi:hypothetical protein
MDELTSPQGSVALAVSALLLVVGYRLARPDRVREWLAVAAYAAALAAQLLAARGLLPGPAHPAGPALRLAGAAVLVVGLVVAGQPSRARRRAALAGRPAPPARLARLDPAYAGLALVVLGQLARAPTLAGAAATAVAAAACLLVAATPSRARR